MYIYSIIIAESVIVTEKKETTRIMKTITAFQIMRYLSTLNKTQGVTRQLYY